MARSTETIEGTAYERGQQSGLFFRSQNVTYGMAHGVYPSNPYHISDPRCSEFNRGYEAGFNADSQTNDRRTT